MLNNSTVLRYMLHMLESFEANDRYARQFLRDDSSFARPKYLYLAIYMEQMDGGVY